MKTNLKRRNVLIRGIPEELHRSMKIKAAREGRSLQSVVLQILTESQSKRGRDENKRK